MLVNLARVFSYLILLQASAHGEVYHSEGFMSNYNTPVDQGAKSQRVKTKKLQPYGQLKEPLSPQTTLNISDWELITTQQIELQRQEQLAHEAEQKEKLEAQKKCFELHQRLTVLSLTIPIFATADQTLYPQWMHDPNSEQRLYLNEEKRLELTKLYTGLANTFCTEQNHASAQKAADHFWKNQKQCSNIKVRLAATPKGAHDQPNPIYEELIIEQQRVCNTTDSLLPTPH